MDEVVKLIIATFGGAVFVGIGTSGVHLLRNRNASIKDTGTDMGTLTSFFFDKPQDKRTRTPASIGWTTKVDLQLANQDETLSLHGSQLAEIGRKVDKILSEVIPDGNGGHNLRGEVTRASAAASRAAEAANIEAEAQVAERNRVAQREQKESP
jgi:hypothetical protein